MLVQLPEDKAASMSTKYVDLTNCLLDPRVDITWHHLLNTRECRAELASMYTVDRWSPVNIPMDEPPSHKARDSWMEQLLTWKEGPAAATWT